MGGGDEEGAARGSRAVAGLHVDLAAPQDQPARLGGVFHVHGASAVEYEPGAVGQHDFAPFAYRATVVGGVGLPRHPLGRQARRASAQHRPAHQAQGLAASCLPARAGQRLGRCLGRYVHQPRVDALHLLPGALMVGMGRAPALPGGAFVGAGFAGPQDDQPFQSLRQYRFGDVPVPGAHSAARQAWAARSMCLRTSATDTPRLCAMSE